MPNISGRQPSSYLDGTQLSEDFETKRLRGFAVENARKIECGSSFLAFGKIVRLKRTAFAIEGIDDQR